MHVRDLDVWRAGLLGWTAGDTNDGAAAAPSPGSLRITSTSIRLGALNILLASNYQRRADLPSMCMPLGRGERRERGGRVRESPVRGSQERM